MSSVPHGRHRLVGRLVWWAMFFAAALLTAPADCWACRTPVYRYAMYNWPAAPGYVFYFHYGQPPPEDEQVNQSIQKMLGEKQSANVIFQAINASDEAAVKQVPKVVAAHYRKHTDGKSPLYLVYTPWGSQLLAGRLDEKNLAELFHSPARQRLGELLHQGNACVWIVLAGSDAQAADAAEKTAREVAEAAAAGKILADLLNEDEEPTFGQPASIQPGPPDSNGNAEKSSHNSSGKDGAPAGVAPPVQARPRLKAAVLRVGRDDPAETWLVRTLLAVEPDLEKYQQEPMVFPVFGRGRVLPPLVGKGITTENLTDCLAYVAGPCSCQVKDENPGLDLLMRWDWEATADALAESEREERGRAEVAYMEIDPVQGRPPVAGAGAEAGFAHQPNSVAAGTTTSNGMGPLPPCCQENVATTGATGQELSDHVLPPGACCYGSGSSFQNRLWLTTGLVLAGAAAAVVLIGTALLRRPS